MRINCLAASLYSFEERKHSTLRSVALVANSCNLMVEKWMDEDEIEMDSGRQTHLQIFK